MNYDPAWDMPLRNWQQQGSYQQAITPLEEDPDSGTLVCLQPINQAWLPVVIGCLDQLCNPSSWSTTDDDQLNTALEQANRLKQMFGERGVCPVPFDLRVDGCELQSSTDEGDTWTEITGWGDFLANCIPPQTLLSYDDGCTLSESFDGGESYIAVPGWVDNFSGCVQKYTPIIGLPPNPNDQTMDQLSCSIASYLAEQVIIAAMGKAVTAIQDDLTLLQFGLDVVNIIPEFVLVTLAADAFAGIYASVQEGTLSDFEDALTDATLLSDITCAIYSCIGPQGYVKPVNFDCITSNVGLISYSHPAVITAIQGYLEALGAVGLAQLSQVAGLVTGADCSACAPGWCYEFDFTVSDGGFASSIPGNVWVPGLGWQSHNTGTVQQGAISLTFPTAGTFTNVDVTWQGPPRGSQTMAFELLNGATNVWNPFLPNEDHPVPITVGFSDSPVTADNIVIVMNSQSTTPPVYLTALLFEGQGTNPFGTNNC